LHSYDVEMLLQVLHKLVDQGNTVIVVEHNLDVVGNADYIVDLGPKVATKVVTSFLLAPQKSW